MYYANALLLSSLQAPIPIFENTKEFSFLPDE